ncbi:TonB-dependent receptor [Sphingomonas parva]|uniref:TonB-dependent receptor n=1 Tax=Sphingomonas parva TaxID=2555898 RepID=A0A4Y8ZSC3_9SPHN|nr:TonB-dependent receptor [Sphingomonas parva]TFI57326.1 TonB-dependent receptor [Sphingomonas parva]
MRRGGQRTARSWIVSGGPAILAALAGTGASAQPAEDAAAPVEDAAEVATPADDAGGEEIVVTGMRGAVRSDVAPVAVLDSDAVAATGATTTGELLRAIKGVTQSADGAEPIFLLNAQRVSGYQEIGSLPPEAIERVEVLPEPVALKFGYPPTRRVVNFITKRRFRQVQARGSAGTTTRGGSARGSANLDLTRLRDDSRLTLALEHRRTGALLQARRDIAPDPDVPFDAIGNIVGLGGGGEIDPALSAAAGGIVTIAPVPAFPADRTLAGFASGANSPRLTDVGPYRTLIARNRALKAETVLAAPLGGGVAGSLNLTAERSRDRSLSGPAAATFLVPAGSAAFSQDVLLKRYLVEADPLRQAETKTTLHAGATLRGAVSGWRWDVTAALDQQQTDGRSERGIDLAAAGAALAADPFAALAPILLEARRLDRTRQRTRNAGAKATLTSIPIALPAGDANLVATAEAERADARSATRGTNDFDLALGRGRVEAGLTLDLPLASRRRAFLSFAGELSANAAVALRRVGGFGSLADRSVGLSWAPVDRVQLLGQVRRSEAAPGLAPLSSPVLIVPDVPIFDFGTGRTEIVTLVQGGNPDLAAERRRVRSLTLNVKPFAKRELRLAASWEATEIADQTGNVYALTPQTEAILPELVSRDAAGRLVSVRFQPINFFRERQRALRFTLNASGQLGKASPPPPAPPPAGAAGGAASPPPPKPKPRPFYYLGAGPSVRLVDRLQLRPGTPELDLLGGDTVLGWAPPAVTSYFYGGINYLGNGMNFDGWFGGGSRVRSDDPEADLRFSPIFKLNVTAFVSVHHFLPREDWTRHLQLRLEVNNLTDAHQRVRDRNGTIPNRMQEDYLDPVGRTVTVSVRKLF